jgi:hydrogenase maturation protease
MSSPQGTGVLVACVGNVLRGDDGFGPAVAARLKGRLPLGAELLETGIGGVAVVQELLAGYGGLVVVDALDDGAEPGTVVAVVPEVDPARGHVPDLHLANPARVLAMAKGLGVLPDRVAIVGCQPAGADDLGEGLSPAVERAVAVAAAKVEEIVVSWLDGGHR